jgi:adenosylcobinamide-GDP ribazoletransferase
VSGLRGAVGFLTPLGGAAPPSPEALLWFPVVGAAIGAALGVLWWAAGRVWPALVAGALVVAADLACTGLLHVDGLVDSADGLLAHLDRERRLAVMSEPTVGAFGVVSAAVVLVTRWAALSSGVPRRIGPAVLLLAALWCAARSLMVLTTTLVPYARAGEGGLASAFLGGREPARAVAVTGLAASFGLLLAWHALAAPAVLAGVLATWAGVLLLARRRIGGFTGDVLGAAGVLGETVGLIVAMARW